MCPKVTILYLPGMKRTPPAELHPLLGALDDDGSIAGIYGVPSGTAPSGEDLILDDTPHVPATYCDHCGYVDGHSPDCPEVAAARAEREEQIEKLAEEAERRGSIRYLLRQAAARALRRLARRIADE